MSVGPYVLDDDNNLCIHSGKSLVLVNSVLPKIRTFVYSDNSYVFNDFDDKIWVLGSNFKYKLGITKKESLVPILIENLPPIKICSVSPTNTLLVDYSGKVFACGSNFDNQLASNNPDYEVFTLIDNLPEIKSVSSGWCFSLFLTISNNIISCGTSVSGRLGTRFKSYSNKLLHNLKIDNIISIRAGNAHGLALNNEGVVFGWGRNNENQLSDILPMENFLPHKICHEINEIFAYKNLSVFIKNDSVHIKGSSSFTHHKNLEITKQICNIWPHNDNLYFKTTDYGSIILHHI